MDLYYAADTARGPVLFRVSIYFTDDEIGPRIFGIEAIEGWDEVRAVMRHIDHRSGHETLTTSLGIGAAAGRGMNVVNEPRPEAAPSAPGDGKGETE